MPRALCALAMTGGFTWGAVRGRRRGEGIPPYGGLHEVRRGRRADVGIGPYGWVTRGAAQAYGGVRAPRPTVGYRKCGRAGGQRRPPLRRGCMRCGGRADVGIGPYGGLQVVRWGGRTEASAPTER